VSILFAAGPVDSASFAIRRFTGKVEVQLNPALGGGIYYPMLLNATSLPADGAIPANLPDGTVLANGCVDFGEALHAAPVAGLGQPDPLGGDLGETHFSSGGCTIVVSSTPPPTLTHVALGLARCSIQVSD